MEEAPEGQMEEARAEHMHDDNGGNEQGEGPGIPPETDEGASAVEAFIAPANEINSDDDDSDPDDHESDDMSVLWQTSFGVRER